MARTLFDKEFNGFLDARTALEQLINAFIVNPNDDSATSMHAAAEKLVECAQRASAARSDYLGLLVRTRRASSDRAASGV
jgi:hypothetical protein